MRRGSKGENNNASDNSSHEILKTETNHQDVIIIALLMTSWPLIPSGIELPFTPS